METDAAERTASVSRWWILFLVHFSVIAFALTLQMIPPLVPQLVARVGLTHAQAGALMGLFTLPGIFLALPGGRVSDVIGPRRVALWSLALISLGTFLMVPLMPFFLYLGRVCSGIGAGVFIVVTPQIIVRRFAGKELGLAMGIFNTAVPIGSIVAFNGLGYLAGRFGILVVITATAGFSLAALTAFFLTYADPPAPAAPEGGAGEARRLGVGIWLVAIVWTLFNMGVLSYFTYSIDHLTEGGLAATSARFLGSLPMMLAIVFSPLTGLILHRTALRWTLPGLGCLVCGASVLLLLRGSEGHPLLWSIVLGLGLSLVPPAVFTIAGEVLPPSRMGVGYGLLNTLFNLGVFFGIPLVGKARDLTLSYGASFSLMAAFLLLGGLLSLISEKLISK
ncbi:MAG: MFS transporter [bacterium]|nr:MAG: MFS transporter [bacterium]